jgi:HD-GYP domain-containing protein (c-di-GMP phosphodiesterase class II)
VRSHHERIDGRGIPDGLSGDAIPLPVRIVSVADSFDAMTSVRPYRPSLDVARAFRELEEGKGKQFSADVIDAFHRAYPDPSSLPIRAPDHGPFRLPIRAVDARRA